MIEAVSKILEAAAKYAWGFFAVCLFVILLPAGNAEVMGLKTIKGDYLGFWWIGLVFSAAIWGGSIFSRVSAWFSAWFSAKRVRRAAKSTIINRLNTLDHGEYMWVAYCLLHNVQTLSATNINKTANSLLNRGIVTRGSGSILSLPFHMRDFVWEHLQFHRDEFLPPEIRADQKKVNMLENFAANLEKPF
jgi:hypothetical protein